MEEMKRSNGQSWIMSDSFWKVLQLVAWACVVLTFYYSNNAATGDSIAKLSERMSVNEAVVQNETAGYRVLQTELAHRMERMEVKIDGLSGRIDRMNERTGR